MRQRRDRKPAPPLDPEALGRLALFYAGRYATTRAKLRTYLARKVRERGWDGPEPAGIEAVVERFAALGYVDDKAFASARSAALQRRGYGERRIGQALNAAGIEAEDSAEARASASEGGWEAARRFAERKRLGPYAAVRPGRDERQKAFAAMMRAGHRSDHARRLLDSAPGEVPEEVDR